MRFEGCLRSAFVINGETRDVEVWSVVAFPSERVGDDGCLVEDEVRLEAGIG